MHSCVVELTVRKLIDVSDHLNSLFTNAAAGAGQRRHRARSSHRFLGKNALAGRPKETWNRLNRCTSDQHQHLSVGVTF